MSARRKTSADQSDLFGGPPPPEPPPPQPGGSAPRSTLPSGDELRDMGIAQALEGQDAFTQEGLWRIYCIHRGWQGTAEKWRFGMVHDGWEPRSDHSWGALTKTAEREGLIMDTGKMEKPTDRRSHSRATKVWRRL